MITVYWKNNNMQNLWIIPSADGELVIIFFSWFGIPPVWRVKSMSPSLSLSLYFFLSFFVTPSLSHFISLSLSFTPSLSPSPLFFFFTYKKWTLYLQVSENERDDAKLREWGRCSIISVSDDKKIEKTSNETLTKYLKDFIQESILPNFLLR